MVSADGGEESYMAAAVSSLSKSVGVRLLRLPGIYTLTPLVAYISKQCVISLSGLQISYDLLSKWCHSVVQELCEENVFCLFDRSKTERPTLLYCL